MSSKNIQTKLIFHLFFILLVILEGCDYQLKNQIASPSGWVIYEFDANFKIKTVGIKFDRDHTCHLPMVNAGDYLTKRTIGRWEIETKNKRKYIKITSLIRQFNNVKFEIKSIETIQDAQTHGLLLKMILVSDSIKMTCYRHY